MQSINVFESEYSHHFSSGVGYPPMGSTPRSEPPAMAEAMQFGTALLTVTEQRRVEAFNRSNRAGTEPPGGHLGSTTHPFAGTAKQRAFR